MEKKQKNSLPSSDTSFIGLSVLMILCFSKEKEKSMKLMMMLSLLFLLKHFPIIFITKKNTFFFLWMLSFAILLDKIFDIAKKQNSMINFLLQTIIEYINYISYFLIFLISFSVLFEPPLSVSLANVIAWDAQNFKEMFIIFRIVHSRYFLHLWIQQQNLLYGFIRSKKAQWILETFLSPKKIVDEWKQQKWNILLFRGGIYLLGLYFCYITLALFLLFILSIFLRLLITEYRKEKYLSQNSFDFNSLPFPIQRRFYELQTPVMKNRMIYANFNKAMISSYNDLCVDRLYLRSSETCHKLFQNFAYLKSSSSILPYKQILTLCSSIDKNQKCKCKNSLFENVKIIHGIYTKFLSKQNLSTFVSLFDFSNVKLLVIIESHLSANDFLLISKMNLNSIMLDLNYDDMSFDEKMMDVLDAMIRIPNLRIHYVGPCINPDEFEIYLVEWVLKNGYIKSLMCIGQISEKLIAFKSSLDVEFHETPDN